VIDEVSSPTFALINEYQTSLGEPVYHFDFYRINDQDEALDIGIDEFFDSGHLCLIEWPERIKNLLPAQTETIVIEMAGEQRVLKFLAER
jgi:tRNA threonylcarbamoyladenosine biosynthesis protein TsaE